MEVKAKCKYDYEAIKALTRLLFSGKRNPKTIFAVNLILQAAVLILIIIKAIYSSNNKEWLFFAIWLLLVIITVYCYYILPRIRYNALAKLKNTENDFVFCDSFMKIISNGFGLSGQTEIQYSTLVKVYETSKYFFVYQMKNSVIIVDKSTVTDGLPEDIRNRLQAFLGDKYYICKY